MQKIEILNIKKNKLLCCNTYCELSIQNLNYSTEQVENINLSQNKFYFNETTFAYELDDLIFYIPQNPEIIYELSIQCNSIFVPILNQQHQLIENFHQNYLLTLLIQPLECQLGEFSQNINDYCHQCRVDLKQYYLFYKKFQFSEFDQILAVCMFKNRLLLILVMFMLLYEQNYNFFARHGKLISSFNSIPRSQKFVTIPAFK